MSPGIAIAEMEDGSGWKIVAGRDMLPGELLLSVPKASILSARTTSLPVQAMQLIEAATPHSILVLSFCLLHELRMGAQSKFYGYLQSLPRDMASALPVFWSLDGSSSDGQRALPWLQGTEAAREMVTKGRSGLGMADMKSLYASLAHHIPPTPNHPNASPFTSFAHAYSLASSRAFLVDDYHRVAMCPMADVLNHSSDPHTCLASDDFVCPSCGSLKPCSHDASSQKAGVPGRLAHLDLRERTQLEDEVDCVEMRLEKHLDEGEEVLNTYGAAGDGKLLVDWGFVAGEFADPGLTWTFEELAELSATGMGDYLEMCAEISRLDPRFPDLDDEDRLLCSQVSRRPDMCNLDQSGRLSINIFGILWLQQTRVEGSRISSQIKDQIVADVTILERSWSALAQDTPLSKIPANVVSVANAVYQLLTKRLSGMHCPDASLEELFDLRDNLDKENDRRQILAITLAANEKSLLLMTIGRWREWINAYTSGVIYK
ncbi:hypothetical protein I350_00389 [Cryptococcus amylolentus CBS 6273]|uniref:SET domain-containing protein n=1 Tax=Cryptococcus amylolentus CBS 6273 TaxID=1296118 RepID=A0A1E3KGA4_9TREE|nr:hypothetical protein I350_00389 [Cryptococcus amylolentus CBS 6273]